jgi:hypothetical protein
MAWPITSAGASRISPLGFRGILALDLGNEISGLAKSNRHSLGEMNAFFVTFRHWIPRRAVPRIGMIYESGFDALVMTIRASSDI